MAESIRNSVSNVLSQTIPNENIARQKMTGLVDVLKNTVNNIGNDWTSKEREDYIFNQVTSLDFINGFKFFQFLFNSMFNVKTFGLLISI